MSHTIQQAPIQMLDDIVAGALPRHCEDPVWIWIFGSGEDLASRMTPWLEVWMDALIKLGDVWCVGDAVGIAALLSPDDVLDHYQAEVRTLPILNEVAAHPDRYWRFWDWITDATPRGGYRLLELSVDAGRRHEGIGSALVKHCLDIAHRDGERVSTVATLHSAVEYFKRSGFEVVHAGQPPGGGPTAWILST